MLGSATEPPWDVASGFWWSADKQLQPRNRTKHVHTSSARPPVQPKAMEVTWDPYGGISEPGNAHKQSIDHPTVCFGPTMCTNWAHQITIWHHHALVCSFHAIQLIELAYLPHKPSTKRTVSPKNHQGMPGWPNLHIAHFPLNGRLHY